MFGHLIRSFGRELSLGRQNHIYFQITEQLDGLNIRLSDQESQHTKLLGHATCGIKMEILDFEGNADPAVYTS